MCVVRGANSGKERRKMEGDKTRLRAKMCKGSKQQEGAAENGRV